MNLLALLEIGLLYYIFITIKIFLSIKFISMGYMQFHREHKWSKSYSDFSYTNSKPIK